MTVVAGAQGHAPTVVIKPIVHTYTVGELIAALEGLPPSTRVCLPEGPVNKIHEDLGAATPFVQLLSVNSGREEA